jgi:acyl-coenzyme A thioesterase PaaI-like protein
MRPTAIAASEELRQATQQREHPHCFACGSAVHDGLRLDFRVDPADGEISADWECPALFRGYDGALHGGLIATLLDSAMVHALFARKVVARTAELQVRYINPINVVQPVTVSARLQHQIGPIYYLKSEVRQHGEICAWAQAKFMSIRP